MPGNAVHMPGGQFKAPTLSLSGDKSVEYANGARGIEVLVA